MSLCNDPPYAGPVTRTPIPCCSLPGYVLFIHCNSWNQTMNHLLKLRKTKKLRMLILSAGGPQSGIQGIYICVEGDAWETVSHAVVPYPDAVEEAIGAAAFSPQ